MDPSLSSASEGSSAVVGGQSLQVKVQSGKDIASNHPRRSTAGAGPSVNRNCLLVVWVTSRNSEAALVTVAVVAAAAGIDDPSPPTHPQPAAASFQRSRRLASAEGSQTRRHPGSPSYFSVVVRRKPAASLPGCLIPLSLVGRWGPLVTGCSERSPGQLNSTSSSGRNSYPSLLPSVAGMAVTLGTFAVGLAVSSLEKGRFVRSEVAGWRRSQKHQPSSAAS